MNDIFLDTVGLIAIWDLDDQWHSAAEVAYQGMLMEGRRLQTTPLVLWECGNAASRRPYRHRVNGLRLFLLQENLLVEPTSSDVEQAWDAFDRGEANNAGIVDHVSFMKMRRLGIVDAFTNDKHFQAAGFTVLF